MSGCNALVVQDFSDKQDLVALAEEIAQLASHIEAANYRLLCLIQQFDEMSGWYSAGFSSLTHCGARRPQRRRATCERSEPKRTSPEAK